MSEHALEPAAQQFADATAQPPFLYELGPDGARKVLDDVQATPITKPDVADKWITVPADVGDVRVRIVKPVGANGMLPTVLYMHGGGWVLGNAATHDRLVRELAVGVNAAVMFVEYDRSPEARYPITAPPPPRPAPSSRRSMSSARPSVPTDPGFPSTSERPWR